MKVSGIEEEKFKMRLRGIKFPVFPPERKTSDTSDSWLFF